MPTRVCAVYGAAKILMLATIKEACIRRESQAQNWENLGTFSAAEMLAIPQLPIKRTQRWGTCQRGTAMHFLETKCDCFHQHPPIPIAANRCSRLQRRTRRNLTRQKEVRSEFPRNEEGRQLETERKVRNVDQSTIAS